MPSASRSDLMTLSYLPPPSSQLASSQLSQYFSGLQVGQSGGITNRGPIPLRSNGFVPMLPALGKCPSAPIPAQSILIAKSRNRSVERLESLEEVAQESPPRKEESMEDSAPVDGGWSCHSYHHRRSSLTKYSSILKNFFDYSNIAKKRVQFADDAGGDLAMIRVICDEWDGRNWEPEPQPRSDWIFGKSSSDVTEEDLVVEVSEWQVNFSQPAADYLGFREKLEANFVGLENVIVKQNPDSFMGTVKVKNVSFKKDVFVRCTFNKWQTFIEFPCRFSTKGSDCSDKYDTFSFEITIPDEAEEHDVIEFCIGFRTDGREHWDSNSGRNYQLITSQSQHRKSLEKHNDAYTINIQEAWSQFASWNHLDTHQPYW